MNKKQLLQKISTSTFRSKNMNLKHEDSESEQRTYYQTN